jgi:histone H3/H4
MPSTTPHGRYTTNSKSLNEDLIILQRQVGRLTNTYYRPNDKTYNTRMIGYFKGKKKVLNDSFAIPPKKVELVDPTSEWVYDLSVEDNENFLDSEGCILLHNTHGILCAPTVASRQFNLWGAAYITTQGQKILGDTLKTLSANKIRVVYGDTDGIYVACSRSAHNLPSLAKTLGIEATPLDKYWLTHPADALKIINECNEKWRERLNYPGFELESEAHDVMIFVKHKNYLIFDESNGQFSMATKGNNFKGSDKPNIARIALERIMKEVLKENLGWEDEAKAREAVRQSIKRITKGLISKLDLSALNLDDLTLVQSVQPSRRYKPNPNGSISVFGARAKALEQLIGVPIRIATKFKFVVTKKPLPGILHPTKSGVKPIDYMYPIELLKDRSEIDLRWYRELIENFIKGAFGLEGMERGVQRGLADWM